MRTKSIRQHIKEAGECPLPCSVCSAKYHHLLLDMHGSRIDAVCKHCGFRIRDVSPNDPLCPDH